MCLGFLYEENQGRIRIGRLLLLVYKCFIFLPWIEEKGKSVQIVIYNIDIIVNNVYTIE